VTELSDAEVAFLVSRAFSCAIDIGVSYLLITEHKAIVRFKKLEKEFRQQLCASPNTFDVSVDELKRVFVLSRECHLTEDFELRFADGVNRWLLKRMAPRGQQREHRPGSGQTISLRGNRAPMQFTEKRKKSNGSR